MIGLIVTIALMLGAIAALVGMAIGAGYAISHVVALSLFESTAIFLGVIGIAAVVIGFMDVNQKLTSVRSLLQDWLGWEDDEEYQEYLQQQRMRITKTAEGEARRLAQKTVMNAPCPCGSGKKYRYCCMKNNSSTEEIEVRQT
jgi:hypothetical protein